MAAPLHGALLHRHLGQAALSCLACREAEAAGLAAVEADAAVPLEPLSPQKQARRFVVRLAASAPVSLLGTIGHGMAGTARQDSIPITLGYHA